MKKQNIERKIKELIRNDDTAALEIIYEEYGNRIYKYLLSVLCSEEKARDVMQNLFVAIAEKRLQLVKTRNLEGYIFIMARNQAMDFLRKQSTKERYERDFQDYENILIAKDSFKEEANDSELREISQALYSLPAEQRAAVSMKIFQAMTFRDIAGKLGCSTFTVASRYRYGLKKLRKNLGRLK
ncbi:MAG: RNA polymerase sigma factor [Candidatus Ratteibacteria bacterium]